MSAQRFHVRLRPEETRELIDRLIVPFQRFAGFGASGGIVLMICTVIALIWANSPWGEIYNHLRHDVMLTAGVGAISLTKPVEWWINDALMAVFFFVVGLEIKREVLVGELSSPRRAALPIVAAIGGMAVPGILYAALNLGEESIRGWGVPVATDIAFALGVLSLLGRRVPTSLRIFVATLAIADDLGALIVIAAFYTDNLALDWLAGGLGVWIVMIGLNLIGVRWSWGYAAVGLVLWYCIYRAGVHPTIAGVLGAMTIPVRNRVDVAMLVAFARRCADELEESLESGENIVTNPRQQTLVQGIEDACRHAQTPLHVLEHALLPWIPFAIVPLFALANAGVNLSGLDLQTTLSSPIVLGIVIGLALGKPIGIVGACLIAHRIGIGVLPPGVRWKHIAATGFLAGIGFTMSLFIANLAFIDAVRLDQAKIGIMLASIISGVVGLTLLRLASRKQT